MTCSILQQYFLMHLYIVGQPLNKIWSKCMCYWGISWILLCTEASLPTVVYIHKQIKPLWKSHMYRWDKRELATRSVSLSNPTSSRAHSRSISSRSNASCSFCFLNPCSNAHTHYVKQLSQDCWAGRGSQSPMHRWATSWTGCAYSHRCNATVRKPTFITKRKRTFPFILLRRGY